MNGWMEEWIGSDRIVAAYRDACAHRTTRANDRERLSCARFEDDEPGGATGRRARGFVAGLI
jgi:hypothetical protein